MTWITEQWLVDNGFVKLGRHWERPCGDAAFVWSGKKLYLGASDGGDWQNIVDSIVSEEAYQRLVGAVELANLEAWRLKEGK